MRICSLKFESANAGWDSGNVTQLDPPQRVTI
jgi:hypothetical protein